MGEEEIDSEEQTAASGQADHAASNRSAVVPDERLHSIPDNWDLVITVSSDENPEHRIYQIPSEDVWVQLRHTEGEAPDVETFTVECVGELSLFCVDDINVELINKVILMGPAAKDFSEEVHDELELLAEEPDLLEEEYAAWVEDLAEAELLERAEFDGVIPLEEWTVSPWTEPLLTEEKLAEWSEVNGNSLEEEAFDEFSSILANRSVVPDEPTVRLEIDDGEGLPVGFYQQGLIEAGCNPAITTDYLMTEIRGLTQKEWAKTRGRDPSTISGHVSEARNQLRQ